MAKILGKTQKDFLSAYVKLGQYLKTKGLNLSEIEYNWKENVGKMTKKEIVILSHYSRHIIQGDNHRRPFVEIKRREMN